MKNEQFVKIFHFDFNSLTFTELGRPFSITKKGRLKFPVWSGALGCINPKRVYQFEYYGHSACMVVYSNNVEAYHIGKAHFMKVCLRVIKRHKLSVLDNTKSRY